MLRNYKLKTGYTEEKIHQWASRFLVEKYDPMRADARGFPIMRPIDIIPTKMYSFHKVKSAIENNLKGVFDSCLHFYIEDYQFERVWNNCDWYIDNKWLQAFDCVLTPDFSLYENMALPIWGFQTFRNRLIGQIWQDKGIKVVPSVNWGGPDTYDIVFRGLPKDSTLSISTMGWSKDKELLKTFQDGIDYMHDTLNPKRFLIYGKVIEDINYHGIETYYFDNDNLRSMRERTQKGVNTAGESKRAEKENREEPEGRDRTQIRLF